MTTWFGNSVGRSKINEFLSSNRNSCFITGPHSLGKRSYVIDLSKDLLEEDVMIAEPGVEDARNVMQFLNTSPISSEYKLVIVVNTDMMQLPSQDAYLKVLEETPENSKIIFIVDDIDLIGSPLRSRAREIIKWVTLTDDDMRLFADQYGEIDEAVFKYSGNRPGVYHFLHGDKRVEHLVSMIKSLIIDGRNLLIEKIPDLLFELDSKSINRMAVIHLLKNITTSCLNKQNVNRVVHVLKYISLISSNPSLNTELHWSRMVADIYSM